MRRDAKERQDARRDLALALCDLNPHDSAEVQAKTVRRVAKAVRSVLGHVLTPADRAWLDKQRPKRRPGDKMWRQQELPITGTRSRIAAVTHTDLQPACTNPDCGSTTGRKRYEGGLCAPCADRAERAGRAP